MAEEKTLTEKPKKLWTGALKMVKGENTNNLIEQFTAEMTLVAEGLCDDQGRLRREVDDMMSQEDHRIQNLETRIDRVDRSLEEETASHDRDMTELRNRLAALEKKAAKEPAAREKKRARTVIRDLTWLVGIAAGAWIVVTILHMIKP